MTAEELVEFWQAVVDGGTPETLSDSWIDIEDRSPGLNSPAKWWRIKPEIDWTKVPVNTKVLCGRYEKSIRYFAAYVSSTFEYVVFDNGCTQEEAHSVANWNTCTLHPDVKIKEEWLKCGKTD